MRDKTTGLFAEDDWAMDTGVSVDGHDMAEPMMPEPRFPNKSNVLTQAEIEALLRPQLDDEPPQMATPQHVEPRLPVRFDGPEHDPAAIQMRQEAGVLAARLSMALGQGTGVKAAIAMRDVAPVATTQLPMLMAGKSGAVACFGASETDTRLLVCLPGPLADALIARACGARGSTGRIGDGWTLSAIDCALLQQLLSPLADVLGSNLRLHGIETDVPYVASLLPAGEVIISEYSVEAPGLHSELAVIRSSVQEDHKPSRDDTAERPRAVTAVVTARIASLSVPMSHLTSLKAGATLLLGLPGDQPVEVLSGDRTGPVAFEGQVGRKGNKVAVKITRKLHGVLD